MDWQYLNQNDFSLLKTRSSGFEKFETMYLDIYLKRCGAAKA
jgi:hypothetical protein